LDILKMTEKTYYEDKEEERSGACFPIVMFGLIMVVAFLLYCCYKAF